MAFGCNPEAIRLNRVRIALSLQSIHNPQDCEMLSTRLRWIAKSAKSLFLGLHPVGPGLESGLQPDASIRNPDAIATSSPIGAQSI